MTFLVVASCRSKWRHIAIGPVKLRHVSCVVNSRSDVQLVNIANTFGGVFGRYRVVRQLGCESHAEEWARLLSFRQGNFGCAEDDISLLPVLRFLKCLQWRWRMVSDAIRRSSGDEVVTQHRVAVLDSLEVTCVLCSVRKHGVPALPHVSPDRGFVRSTATVCRYRRCRSNGQVNGRSHRGNEGLAQVSFCYCGLQLNQNSSLILPSATYLHSFHLVVLVASVRCVQDGRCSRRHANGNGGVMAMVGDVVVGHGSKDQSSPEKTKGLKLRLYAIYSRTRVVCVCLSGPKTTTKPQPGQMCTTSVCPPGRRLTIITGKLHFSPTSATSTS